MDSALMVRYVFVSSDNSSNLRTKMRESKESIRVSRNLDILSSAMAKDSKSFIGSDISPSYGLMTIGISGVR